MNIRQYDEVLHHLKLESIYYSRSCLGGGNWAIDVPAYEDTSMFHVVISGSCLISINDQTLEMQKGDVVFIPRAQGHVVSGRPGETPIDLYTLPVNKVSELYETLELDIDEPAWLPRGARVSPRRTG